MAHRTALSALAVALSALVRAADPAADRVTSLPGWSDAFRSARYSGFLKGSDATRHISYFFVESEGDPASDPVVLWLNGGPGCSSFIGLWLEQGPLTMGGDGLITENAGRWNAHASVLFIESPPGVGFSYIDGAKLPYVANDTTTSADSLGALQDFFASYPAFASRPLWLSGESYAGIYVPWLAQAILASGDARLVGQLKGILVGNGALKTADAYEGLLTQQRMLHASQHGLFSMTLRAQIDAACTNWTAPRAPACDALLATQQAQMGPLNAYNIEVTCLGSSSSSAAAAASPQQRALLRSSGSDVPEPALGASACTAADEALTAYYNRADVQAALHVQAGAAVIGAWGECQGGTVDYTRIPVDQTKTVYPQLLAAGLAVAIYNGDQDECIPYIQDEAWTAEMGFAVTEDWRPWLLDEQVAGYVREFQAPAAGGRFSFITVKRAGHEVRPSKTNPEPHPHRCTLTVKFDTPRLPQFRTT